MGGNVARSWCLLPQACAISGNDQVPESGTKRVLRVVKILRILKIMRLLKGIKIIEYPPNITYPAYIPFFHMQPGLSKFKINPQMRGISKFTFICPIFIQDCWGLRSSLLWLFNFQDFKAALHSSFQCSRLCLHVLQGHQIFKNKLLLIYRLKF